MGLSTAAARSDDKVNDPEGDGKAPDSKLYEKLGELARFIDTSMKTLSEVSVPVSASSEQLPQAQTHLLNLKAQTEQGTHEVMRQVEAIQDHHTKITAMLRELTLAIQKSQATPALEQQVQHILQALGSDDKRLLDIMTACPFRI